MRARLGIFLALLAGSPAFAQDLPAGVQAVIDRSRSTRADYAVVLSAEVVRNGTRAIEIDAEFQQGPLHRVEVPAMRVLANCDTGEAYVYDVLAGHLVDRPDTAAGACGISLGVDQVISGRLLNPVNGTYGRADVIELTGTNFVRRYAVTEDGIIVAEAYVPRRADVTFSLRTLGVAVSRGRQDPAMFDRGSLSRAFASGPPSGELNNPQP